MRTNVRVAAGLAVAMLCPSAMAHEAGDWVARLGMHYIDPKNDNHDIVSVDGAPGITGSVVYFATPTVAVDLLLAVPFKHDIELEATGDEVASARHLPPTLSLVWYPKVSDAWHPFIGAGLNYTTFFQEKTKGALDGTHLRLDDSFGAAFVIGTEVELTPSLSVTLDARYIDIETEAHLDGDSLGDVEIDPVAVGLSVGYRF